MREANEETKVTKASKSKGRVKGERVTRKELVAIFLIIQRMIRRRVAKTRKMVLGRVNRLAAMGRKKRGNKRVVVKMTQELSLEMVLMKLRFESMKI